MLGCTQSWSTKKSERMVLWNLSTLPVVVGEYGAVSKWRIPLLVQIRSKSTGPGPWPKRAVKTLPLSVRIWSGTPWARSAHWRASHTGLAVARATTRAQTQNREWSSTPVTTLTSVPSARWKRPTMSICHSSMERDRSHRL